MHVVDIDKAKDALPELLVAAREGQDVILTRNGQPVVRLVVLVPARPHPWFDSARGLVRAGADVDTPLPGFDGYLR